MQNKQNTGFNYDEKYFEQHFASPFYRRYLALRNKFIHNEITKLVPTGKFLEIGFGDDNLIKLFKNKFDVFGLDISEFAVKDITRRYDPSHFKTCDISKGRIPFKNKFSVICAINTVEHLSDPEFGLKNICNALLPGGIFLVYMPTASTALSRLQYRLLYDVEEHIYRPSIQSLKNTLTRIGFRLAQEYAGSVVPFKISNKPILESLNLYLGLWKKP